MDKIAQDVGDIQSRLIDHRPVINSEIRYLVKEFEEKRGYRESRLLESVNKMVLETKEQMQMSNMEASAQQLSEIHKRLEAANHMAARVQQRELEAQQVSDSLLFCIVKSSACRAATIQCSGVFAEHPAAGELGSFKR
ncbi:biogenesis of lysosome-related organelles complex 1 subunit 5 isoform X2 [Takifugu flavidus]|uniref:biogenesis of lysosome-related organelles complex 1 subunit 5 isoform X2 n=1 Tax=Takifugu flavidus TaxID=433684 RepID=UPI0025448BBA|nr:biogenesis of lysosome-related organelles complex 1 subunit 5 isoform X2 [Takifugu flavidus]